MKPIPRVILAGDGQWRIVESEFRAEYAMILKIGRIATPEEIDRYRFGDSEEAKS